MEVMVRTHAHRQYAPAFMLILRRCPWLVVVACLCCRWTQYFPFLFLCLESCRYRRSLFIECKTKCPGWWSLIQVEWRLFNGESINYGKMTVFIYVIILRILLEGEGGSIKCGHLDEGVLVVCLFVFLRRSCVFKNQRTDFLFPASFP